MVSNYKARYRQVAAGIYTTAVGRDPIKGEDLVLEKHWGQPKQRRPIPSQTYWWTFRICGGDTDGEAYPTRQDAELAAICWRDGIIKVPSCEQRVEVSSARQPDPRRTHGGDRHERHPERGHHGARDHDPRREHEHDPREPHGQRRSEPRGRR